MQQCSWTKTLSLIKIYISIHTQHVSFHCSVLQQRSISLSDIIIIILISHRSSKRLNIQFILYLLYQTTNWIKSYDMIQKWKGKKKIALKNRPAPTRHEAASLIEVCLRTHELKYWHFPNVHLHLPVSRLTRRLLSLDVRSLRSLGLWGHWVSWLVLGFTLKGIHGSNLVFSYHFFSWLNYLWNSADVKMGLFMNNGMFWVWDRKTMQWVTVKSGNGRHYSTFRYSYSTSWCSERGTWSLFNVHYRLQRLKGIFKIHNEWSYVSE